MKKSFKKVLAVIMSVIMLLGATSITSLAADRSESFDNIVKSVSDWINAIINFDMSDFNDFVTAILGVFGFKGSFEGVHSIPALVDEWFGWFGDLGGLYETIINWIDTDQLVAFINNLLSGFGK